MLRHHSFDKLFVILYKWRNKLFFFLVERTLSDFKNKKVKKFNTQQNNTTKFRLKKFLKIPSKVVKDAEED